MKYIKKFENYNINSDYFLLRRVLKSTKQEFYNIQKYQLAIINLNLVISKLIKNDSRYNTLLLTICAISLLTKESKEKVKNLFNFALTNDITEEEINNVVDKVKLIFELFTSISKQFEKNITIPSKILSNTSILIPFLSVLKDFIDQDKVNIDWFDTTKENLKLAIGLDKYKRLISRMMHKIKIIVSSTNKFQNVENVKPLLANQELKPPMYKKIKPSI